MTKWEVAKLAGADPAQPDFEALADLAVQGLPETDHENQAWKSKNVKQYYFTKKLHKERIDENTSALETKQHCEALENQAFQQVESALAVHSDRTHVVLGSSSGREGRRHLKALQESLQQPEEGSAVSLCNSRESCCSEAKSGEC